MLGTLLGALNASGTKELSLPPWNLSSGWETTDNTQENLGTVSYSVLGCDWIYEKEEQSNGD